MKSYRNKINEMLKGESITDLASQLELEAWKIFSKYCPYSDKNNVKLPVDLHYGRDIQEAVSRLYVTKLYKKISRTLRPENILINLDNSLKAFKDAKTDLNLHSVLSSEYHKLKDDFYLSEFFDFVINHEYYDINRNIPMKFFLIREKRDKKRSPPFILGFEFYGSEYTGSDSKSDIEVKFIHTLVNTNLTYEEWEASDYSIELILKNIIINEPDSARLLASLYDNWLFIRKIQNSYVLDDIKRFVPKLLESKPWSVGRSKDAELALIRTIIEQVQISCPSRITIQSTINSDFFNLVKDLLQLVGTYLSDPAIQKKIDRAIDQYSSK